MKSLSSNPNPAKNQTMIIDVREPSEYSAGAIPTAINMPIQSQPEGLFLPPDEFRDRFGFDKPDPQHTELVFYCKAGVRSRFAARMAVEQGYASVGEYRGSWDDWVRRSGGG